MKKISLIFCIISNVLMAQKILTEWETSIKSESIELQYRWVLIGDTLETREMRSIFKIECPREDIIFNLSDDKRFKSWSVGVTKCKALNKNYNGWIMYSFFDIPMPFSDKDLIANYELKQKDRTTIIQVTALPDYLPKKEGVERMKNYSAYWILEEKEWNKTLVKFHSIAYTKPVFPRFIQDPLIQSLIIKSFEKLIILSEGKHLQSF